RCYSFDLAVSPHAQAFSYQDYLGNEVHHFDIPGYHDRLTLEARALVELPPPESPPDDLPMDTWETLDALWEDGEHLDMTLPSTFARPSAALHTFIDELDWTRRTDPLRLLRELNQRIYETFAYSSEATHVHSPIDDALASRGGVCQDFAHLFIALARHLRIPCRYVSGYLFYQRDGSSKDRSAEDESHAWVETYLPGLGWVGFDPTNNILAEERHIRVALGRDYADVPPTRGVYKGSSGSTLRVGVHVAEATFAGTADVRPDLALVTHADARDPEPAPQQSQQQQ
ncbi:MAG: transglutaminase family protein, partial [Bacteroidota bacterium]